MNGAEKKVLKFMYDNLKERVMRTEEIMKGTTFNQSATLEICADLEYRDFLKWLNFKLKGTST